MEQQGKKQDAEQGIGPGLAAYSCTRSNRQRTCRKRSAIMALKTAHAFTGLTSRSVQMFFYVSLSHAPTLVTMQRTCVQKEN